MEGLGDGDVSEGDREAGSWGDGEAGGYCVCEGDREMMIQIILNIEFK
jgi:hypothetical protein